MTVKPFLSYVAQVEHLRACGMYVEDERKAMEILSRVNYYRLINAYGLGLYADADKHRFREGVTFWQVYSLYAFDNRLRHVVSELLEEFEVLFRSRLAHYIGEHYGALGYLNPAMFANGSFHQEIIETIGREKAVQHKSPVVKHHNDKYGGNLPIWATVEISTFGTMSKLYKNMLPSDQAEVAKQFGLTPTLLNSWLRAFVEVRNICAHYGRLYNKALLFPPRLFRECKFQQNSIFAVLYLLRRFVEPEVTLNCVVRLREALCRYPAVELRRIGFPENWETLLLDK